MTVSLTDIYQRLLASFGPQHWWPGESPFEVIVGAILVQNTAWKNVEQAVENLRLEGVLSPTVLSAIDQEELEDLIKPAGYFRLKARRLKNFLDFLMEQYSGSVEEMFQTDLSELRGKLLMLNGIGPETADSILLYAGNLPTFVIDTYTSRVLKRHGWIDYDADYYLMKEHFESSLPADQKLFNEYHALLVRVGHLYCRKTPKCDECPLKDFLPESGIQKPME